ncbi:hypothetical protein [Nannocystis pusilla]|uniref:hypothetical protein n=1 Tax=Nannocystis pusilla TaxID=889268 RepID=UPI003DA4A125
MSAACSPVDAPAAVSGSEGGAPLGDAEESACECIDREQFGLDSLVCRERSCGSVTRGCVSADEQGDDICGAWARFEVDAEKLDCALDDLIMGRPGVIAYEDNYVPDDPDGAGDSSFPHEFLWGGFIQVLPARRGLGRDWTWISDLDGTSVEETAANVYPLKDSAYFAGCKAELDLSRRFDCLLAWKAGEALSTCDEVGVIEYPSSEP